MSASRESGSMTLADYLQNSTAGSAGNAVAWPDAPQTNPRSSVDWLRQYLPTPMGDWLARSEAEGLDWGKAMSNPRTAAGEVISTAMNLVPMGRLAVPRAMGGRPMLPDIHGNLVEPGIQMNHVSPYDFAKPDISKIGTGQGAQSYGSGLYAATNPKVSGGPGSQYWNEFAEAKRYPNAGDPATDTAVNYLLMTNGNKAAAIDRLVSMQSRLKDRHPGVDGAIELLKSDKPVGPVTYQWNVRAKPEQFLDWDRPIGQQPEIIDKLRSNPLTAKAAAFDRPTGAEFYENRLLLPDQARPAASAALRDAGIPGIRYLDQGSRNFVPDMAAAKQNLKFWQDAFANRQSAGGDMRGVEHGLTQAQKKIDDLGSPSSNYVLFNDKIIDVMKKWSLAGAIPFAAASEYDGRF